MWVPLAVLLICLQANLSLGASLNNGARGCGKADIIFILDQSYSIWEENMVKAKKFIAGIIEEFPIGNEDFQVGLISFASYATRRITLNRYLEKESLTKALVDLPRMAGPSTATHDGLKMLRESIDDPNFGARVGVPKIAVLITDGSSSEPHKMAAEAAMIHQRNITMFAIGLPDRYNHANITELNIIATDPDERHRFMVDDWNVLNSIKLTIRTAICKAVVGTTSAPTTTKITTTPKPTTTIIVTTTAKPTTTPEPSTTEKSTPSPTEKPTPEKTKGSTTVKTTPSTLPGEGSGDIWTPQPVPTKDVGEEGHGCRRTDIMFIPSETAGPIGLNYIGEFISSTTQTLKFDTDKYRIGTLPTQCFNWEGFDMGTLTSVDQINKKIDSWRFNVPDTARLLKEMRAKFNATDEAKDSGTITRGVRRVAILFLDSKSYNLEDTIKEAHHAQEKGVEIFVIAVGKNYSQAEAEMIASLHSAKHRIQVESYSQLQSQVSYISEQLSVCPRVC